MINSTFFKIKNYFLGCIFYKKIHMDFLGYMLEHQTPNLNYFNRYLILRERLSTEYFHFHWIIDQSRKYLLLADYIEELELGQLHVTEEGIKFYREKNQFNLMHWLERAQQIFNKRFAFLVVVLSLYFAARNYYLNLNKMSYPNNQQTAFNFFTFQDDHSMKLALNERNK